MKLVTNNNSKMSFAYLTDTSYIVCSCEIDDNVIDELKREIKQSDLYNNIEILHNFDNMLGSSEGVINLNNLAGCLIENIEEVSKFTSKFLDSLKVKERKVLPIDEFSQNWKFAQLGTFGKNLETSKSLREYESSLYNKKIMKSIGYDLQAKNNRKHKEKQKILCAEA